MQFPFICQGKNLNDVHLIVFKAFKGLEIQVFLTHRSLEQII